MGQSPPSQAGSEFYVYRTMHCNTVIQYKPYECTLSKLVFSIFNFDFMFRTLGFIFRKLRYGTLYIHQYK